MRISVLDQIQASQQPLQRAASFGDGFFTTGIVEQGKLKHLDRHLARLEQAAASLAFKPLAVESLRNRLSEALLQHTQASCRISISRLQANRGYAIADEQTTQVEITLSPWQPLPQSPCRLEYAQTPISVNPVLAGIKHLNRLDNVLAASECQSADEERLMCNGDSVICASRANLFVVHKGVWRTPSLTNCGINGITRQRILDKAAKAGIPMQECTLLKADIAKSEAAFISNSLLGIWAVSKIADKDLATDLVSELQSKLDFER